MVTARHGLKSGRYRNAPSSHLSLIESDRRDSHSTCAVCTCLARAGKLYKLPSFAAIRVAGIAQ